MDRKATKALEQMIGK